VGYRGLLTHTEAPNLKSAVQQPVIVNEKLEKEINANRIAGPFPTSPFPNLRVSPIGIVPKKQTGKFRLIHHLSYPQGDSINDGIPEEEATVQYQSIDDATTLIRRLGKDSYLAKTDIAEAFRIVPLHPSQYPLFGIKWQDKFFYDKCLPMGCRSSCRIFETLSNALQWMSNTRLGIKSMSHILDDFLIGEKEKSACQYSLNKFLALCSNLGIPTAPEKTTQPTKVLSFVGYELDTHNMEVRLPADKLTKGKALITECMSKEKVQLRFMQSVIGFLNFACGAIVPGRPFLRRLINLTIGIREPFYYLRITKAARADLLTWEVFLSSFNGKSLMLPVIWNSSNHMQMYTDAAGATGYGAIMGYEWFFGRWEGNWQGQSITLLELYPIVVAVETWSQKLANCCVEFHSDNQAVTIIINKQTSKDEQIMVLVRRLVLTCLRYNILFQAYHIPGVKNILADALSRLQVEEFRRLAPLAAKQPTPIPPLPELPPL
jgi:hypothetical protein